MIFNISKDIKFSNFYKKMNVFSSILIFLSILVLLIKGLNLGVDFKGGTLIEVRTENVKSDIAEIRQSLLRMKLGDVTVKKFGKGNDYLVKIEMANTNDGDFIKSINPSEMSLYNENKIKILDVRKKNELELGLVKDSIHIPLDEIYVNINKLKKTEKYLIYCAGGYRSMIACSILKSKGYHQVHSIYGGFKAISENIK